MGPCVGIKTEPSAFACTGIQLGAFVVVDPNFAALLTQFGEVWQGAV